jgi:ribosomal protein L7/L12
LEIRMARLEKIVQVLLDRVGVDPGEFAPQEEHDMTPITAALLAGNKILAIKLYRETFNVGLKEAKDAIDAMEREMRGLR